MKRAPAIILSFLVAGLTWASTASAITFTDWTVVDIVANTASGNLGGTTVTFAGVNIDQGVTNGTFTGFNSSLFTPPLANSDFVGFRGAPAAYNYLLTFSAPVDDPVFHFYSLASDLTFSTSDITRLSGDPDFLVAGNVLSGILNDSPRGYDANGTIRLNGSYTSIAFTAAYFDSREDGIVMQVGGTAGTPVPEPGTLGLLFSGLMAGLAGQRIRRRTSS